MRFNKRRILFIWSFCITLSFWWHMFSTSKISKSQTHEHCEQLSKDKLDLINNLTSSSFILSPEQREFLNLKDLAIASIASLDHIGEAIRSCDSIQQHPQLKNVPFLMYFIGEIPKNIHNLYAQFCPIAEIIILDHEKYSFFLDDDFDHYKFKALYQALTLQKYKAVLSIDCSIRFPKQLEFDKLIFEAIKRNPLDLTLLSSAKHTAYPVIHPIMYNCFPAINPQEMQKIQQFQSGLMLWIGSENGRKILKRFLECTLQENCIAPPGAEKHCDYAKIYSDNTTFSGCHRFDQSAINLILYEESLSRPKLFQWNHPDFIIVKSSKLLL